MLKLLVTPFLVAAALVCTAQSSASLIQVRFDDFTDPVADTTVFNSDGFIVNRKITTSGGGAFGGGSVGIIGAGSVVLNYTIVAAPNNDLTFNNLFDYYKAAAPASPKGTINPSAGGIFDGFGFDISLLNPSATATAEISYNGGFTYLPAQAITTSGFYAQQPGGNTSNFALRITETTAPGMALFLGNVNVVAVPEPTALLMVGSALVGLTVIRRRK